MNGCAQSDQTCLNNCYQSGTTTAQQQYDALATCYQNNCATATDGQTCLENNCSTQVQACLGGSTTGGSTTGGSTVGKTCSEVLQCMNGCPSGDQTCLNNCYQSGSATAQQQYDALAACYQQNNCDTAADGQTCLQNNCGAEVQACLSS